MKISEKIIKETTPNGAIKVIVWKKNHLRKMLLPEKSLTKIPNKPWEELRFPFEIMEDVINDSAARVTFILFMPSYEEDFARRIANKFQHIIYDNSKGAELQRKAAVRSIIKNTAVKTPQLDLVGDVISISNREKAFKRAIRFTTWSILPTELLQTRMIWSNEVEQARMLIELEVTLLFDQQLIDHNCRRINRHGLLAFDIREWNTDFDLDAVIANECASLEKLKTPEKIEEISSEEEKDDSDTTVEEKPRPRKRIRLTNRFAVSSEEDTD